MAIKEKLADMNENAFTDYIGKKYAAASDAVKGRVDATKKSMGKKGYEGGIPHSQREKDAAAAAEKTATMSKWGIGGAAAAAAGIGAVMLAKKLRAKKKKAAKKAQA
jgi:hypothetical protein